MQASVFLKNWDLINDVYFPCQTLFMNRIDSCSSITMCREKLTFLLLMMISLIRDNPPQCLSSLRFSLANPFLHIVSPLALA